MAVLGLATKASMVFLRFATLYARFAIDASEGIAFIQHVLSMFRIERIFVFSDHAHGAGQLR